MYEGKNRRIELIRELQTTHALQVCSLRSYHSTCVICGPIQGPQITAKRKEKEAVESKQRQKERDEHQASIVSCLVDNSAYTLLGKQLDNLSKELVRLQVNYNHSTMAVHAWWLYAVGRTPAACLDAISRKRASYEGSRGEWITTSRGTHTQD